MTAPEYIIVGALLLAVIWLGVCIINASEQPRDLTADEIARGGDAYIEGLFKSGGPFTASNDALFHGRKE